jgi:hypothetical protein
MHLINDWKTVLKRAWSIRLIILAGTLTGLEVALPLFSDAVPRGVFAGLSAIASIAALWARVVAQKSPEDAS